MLNAFLFHFKDLFPTHGKDGFYGFNGEPPEVVTKICLKLIQFLQSNTDCINSMDKTDMPETNSRM